MSTTLETTIDKKRRPTLPRAVMEEAGIEPGQVVEVRSTGPGRVELVTRQARIAEAIAFLRGAAAETPLAGALEELREIERGQFEDRLADRPADDGAPNPAADALLARLGL